MNVWRDKFFQYFRLRKPVPLSQWADAHRVIGDGAGPEPGRWRTERTPYMRAIMDAVTDPAVHEVVMCTGVQLGKTELLLNTICYYIAHEPSPILLVEPSEELSIDIGRDRIDTMIKSSPELRPLFGFDDNLRIKQGQLSSSIKRFAGGYLKLASAASPTDLKSRPIRVILCDEVDTFPPRQDGDAVDMAIARASNFTDRKILLTSTPGALASSEIWRRLSHCARHEYQIPCQHCGTALSWKWAMVKWDTTENGTGDPSTARMECPFCGGIIRDGAPAPYPLLSSGWWELVEGDPACGKMGFHLPSLYSPWMPLSGIVSEWLAANKARDIDRLRTFIQDRLAEPWDERPPSWHDPANTASADRFEDHPDHSAIRFLTAGVDVQRDRIEVSIWGFAASMESWAISHTVFTGDPLSVETWTRVRDFLLSPVDIADGRSGFIYGACIDSGDGYSTQMVYRFCAPLERRHIVAIKGVAGDRVPLISPPSRTATLSSPLYRLGVDRLKRVIYDRLNIGMAGPGYVHIPRELSDEFWAQLTSESPETVVERGKEVTRWKKHRKRNEALDCAAYALAAYELFCHPHAASHGRRR